MKLTQATRSLLAKAIKESLARYTQESMETEVLTDIHLQPDPNTGELTIFDDDDNVLAVITVDEWNENGGGNFYEGAEKVLASVLGDMKEAGDLDNLTLMKPYSFVMVDAEKETIAELLLVDDDTLLLNEELLKGLDQELDDFLDNLMNK